jgi:hypothetical protein
MGLAADIREWTKKHFDSKCMLQPYDYPQDEKLYLVIQGNRIQFCAWIDLDTLDNSNGCEFIHIPPVRFINPAVDTVNDLLDKARHEWTANVRHFFATRLNEEITKRNEATLQAAKELAEQQHYMGYDIDTVIDMLDGEYDFVCTELDEVYAHLEAL